MENIKEILFALEQALRAEKQWQQQAPSPKALASQLPFCYDTLEFNQWLQWIFIPRIYALLDAKSALPTGSAIHEYAEEVYKGVDYNAGGILLIIKSFDEMIAAGSRLN